MTMATALVNGFWFSGFHICRSNVKERRFALGFGRDPLDLKCSSERFATPLLKRLRGGSREGKGRLISRVMSPEIASPNMGVEILEARDDEYDGVIVDPRSLPTSSNAFASALNASLYTWKSKGKKGVWLKIFSDQADLVPIAIQEGFEYHHAEPGYVMLTYWIPKEPCTLPGSPSHQIGVGAFVINDNREVLVVKEKCPCSCSGVWKLPTGYINKSEDIFLGAVREVKEETGVDTIFLEMVAFRHVHQLQFDESDLLFICMLKPASNEITVDGAEIQDAKWMALDEFLGQRFYDADEMSRKIIDVCYAAYEDRYRGFDVQKLPSKLDGRISSLYYHDNSNHI